MLAPVRALLKRLARPFANALRRRVVADLRADLDRLLAPDFYPRLPEAARDDLAALQPLVARLRQDVLAQVRQELREQHEAYLAFHTTLAFQVADDLARLQKALDALSSARAA